jgi:hypothetical protein
MIVRPLGPVILYQLCWGRGSVRTPIREGESHPVSQNGISPPAASRKPMSLLAGATAPRLGSYQPPLVVTTPIAQEVNTRTSSGNWISQAQRKPFVSSMLFASSHPKSPGSRRPSTPGGMP